MAALADSGDLDFEDVLVRCYRWEPGQGTELKELGSIIRATYKADDMVAVEQLCLALLENDQLPSFYKAKMYAYLSTCDDHDSRANLLKAFSYICDVKSVNELLGYLPDEVERWDQIIEAQWVKVEEDEPLEDEPLTVLTHRPRRYDHDHDEHCDHEHCDHPHPHLHPSMSGAVSPLPDAPPITGLTLGMIDGTQEVPPALATKAAAAKEHVMQRWFARVKDAFGKAIEKQHEEQKPRQEMAKNPKAMRKKLSVANFQTVEGSKGTLRSPKLKPKASSSNLVLEVQRQDEEAVIEAAKEGESKGMEE